MDVVGGLLDGTRAKGAFILRSVLAPPWSIRVRDQAPLSVAVVVQGQAWVEPDTGPATQLDEGDIMLARGPAPYTVGDNPGTPPTIFIDPGQLCTDRLGRPMSEAMSLGGRSWGNSPDGSTVMVTGTYEHASAVSERVLRALPELLVLRKGDWSSGLVDLLCAETQRDAPGQEVFLDRLLDLVVLGAVRSWISSSPVAGPAWYLAGTDRLVGEVLGLFHERPEYPWTVSELALAVGVSRAWLARRFTAVVGEPPMTYLTQTRLALAADLLEQSDATIAAIARQVGYGSPFALSAAFTRVRGLSPAQHRAKRASNPLPPQRGATTSVG